MDRFQAMKVFVIILDTGSLTAAQSLGKSLPTVVRTLSNLEKSLVAQGKLIVLLTEFEQPAIPVNLTHSHTRLVPNRVRTLSDWLADDLGQRLSSQTLI